MVLATAEPGRVVLVDTGPEPTLVLDCLRDLGVSRIALVVISHLHADHIGGLGAVLTDYPVGAVGVGLWHEPSWAWAQVQRESRNATVPLVGLAAGQRMQWPGLNVAVMAPRRVPTLAGPNLTGTVVNDASLVLMAETTAGRALLTGDVELAGQAGLVLSGVDLEADVLKVPHHGSRYSSPAFLARVRPRVAMVSVGAGNRFGHPSPFILQTLARQGATVLRTDTDGDVAVLGGPQGPLSARRGQSRAPPR
ncbi:MAG: MBL fold metallo-hydrolase [Kutzneria sp.]|nr:MBL fold metallo-hydrolase [Kutzneria sp.]